MQVRFFYKNLQDLPVFTGGKIFANWPYKLRKNFIKCQFLCVN
jgi:hypothetical protein